MKRILDCGNRALSCVCAIALVTLFTMPSAEALTYVNAATTFSWIDATTHTKVGAHTAPYQFRSSTGGCGTTAPIIDDTISDIIPLGFNFVFGDKVFDSVRIMSNGRIHFVSTTLPLDNTTCGYGSPVTQLPYPIASLTYTMRIYGNDMDPTLQADYPSATPCVNSNSCYISFASIGTAPNRQFVVTWNNVPEWATFSSATGNYNLQIIINEGGDFIYQYGTDTPGPQAALGQVGWEVATADYDTPAVGYPVPNTAIHFFIPHPVVEYLMEQPSWSGSASVLDTSGNAKNGSPLGTAQTVAGGKVCRGASIPASATGANAINSTLSVPGTIGNSGTIAFWYKANTAWSGVGTSDALLFDATSVNNQWFFLARRGGNGANAGKLVFVITDSTGTDQIVQTPAIAVAAGTWKHIVVTWNFNNLAASNNDLLTIYVDGVQQAQTTFTSTTRTLSSQIGTLYIGGSRNSFSRPSNGTTQSMDGTVDEFRAYNYEAKLSFVSTIMNMNTGGCLSHYAIADAGTGLTCALSQFTIAAHTGSHGPYVNNALVSLSTSDGTGTWTLINGHGFVTNIGSNTGNATYLYNNESQVLLGLTHPTGATVTAHITDGTYSEQENTPLVISDCVAGKFNACEVTNPRCVPIATSAPTPPSHNSYAYLYTKLTNTVFALDVVAVKVDGTLDTTFNKTVSVNLLVNTTAPLINASTNCPTSQTATISLGSVTLVSGRAPTVPQVGVAVAANAFSNVSPNYSAYRDVRVQFVCTAANCGTAGTWCATDAFTVRPQSFTTITSSANADNSGASATLIPVVKAGAAFTLTADTTTAGYNGKLKIDTSKTEWLSAPSGGRAAPGVGTVSGLSGSIPTPATLATGNGASDNFTYDEVGYFRFQAGGVYDVDYASISGDIGNGDCINTPPNDFSNTPVGGKYGCKIANQAATNYFGRFIPDHFAVINPLLTQGCVAGAFSYMDQPFSLTASIEAQTSSGVKTQNYSGASFAKGVVSAQAENANNGTSLGNRVIFTAPWSNGAAAFSVAKFSRINASTPDGPYDALSIGATVTDADNVYLINRDMDQTKTTCTADSAGTSNGTCVATTLTNSAKLRFGTLKITNAFGSELLALPVALQAQYWSNGSWITNSADSCTSIPVSAISMGNYTKNLAACKTILSPGSGNLTLANGSVSGGLRLSKPGTGNDGSVDLSVNTSAASGNTCLSGTQSAATNANLSWLNSITGKATFGVYKGSKEFIYMREAY